jgi:beta-mannosidase
MVQASVPGNASLDWARGNNWPDHNKDANYKLHNALEAAWWLYEARIPCIKLEDGEELFFVTEGIDYEYIILLDGIELLRHEGMFSRMEIPISDKEGALIQVWVLPPPKDPLGAPGTRSEAAQSAKPAVSYGWDWHPRLIPSGIWEETYLDIRQRNRLKDVQVDYDLNEDLSSASVAFRADVAGHGDASLILKDPCGKTLLLLRQGETGSVDSPMLWWCNGYGEPNLYRWEVVLSHNGHDVDKASGTVGFRKIELTMDESIWYEYKPHPVTRRPAPITVTLNNVPVFAKGSNWVNPEIFTGTITRDTYVPLIRLAREANFNLLRCWGGAIVNKPAFFELCDENGLMVWQEFPLACNNYRGTPAYLKTLEQEARAIIAKLRSHPSLVIWCGGNELFNSWSKMTDQSLALRLLNKLCYELDITRPFLQTAPLMGMGHGYYLFRYPNGQEVFESMPKAHKTAYSEFGVPSISNIEVCKAVANESLLFPMLRNEVTSAHHAFDAWIDTTLWSSLDTLNYYFGEARSLDELIKNSQWLQSEGLKCIFEEARRQKPYCSMALNWCYNEPWPTLANCSIINYPAAPKSSYKDVAASCRDRLISGRVSKFVWHSGETLEVDLWLLNDGRAPVPGGDCKVSVELDGKVYQVQGWQYEGADANKNAEGPTVRMTLPKLAPLSDNRPRELTLILDAMEMSSRYRLLYKA